MSKHAEDPTAGPKSKKASKTSSDVTDERSARQRPDAIEGDRRGRPERGGPPGRAGVPGRGHRGSRRSPGRGERGEPIDRDELELDLERDPRRGHRGPGGRGGRGPGGRARRGEVRNGVLALLAEGPKHGYQIIQELGERSGGAWTPSPGSVYPILHRLEGNGVVAAEDHEDGRRVFTLTSTGQLVVDRLDLEKSPPWATMGSTESDEAKELRRLAVQFDGAIGQVAEVATADQLERAAAIVAEARRRLYALLAEDPSEAPGDTATDTPNDPNQ